jgi:pathogenesis-related protein 1
MFMTSEVAGIAALAGSARIGPTTAMPSRRSLAAMASSLFALGGCVDVFESTPVGAVAAAPPPTSPASSTPATTGEPAALAGITAAHNRVRARVGVPPLNWNPRLAEVAQRWADACVDRQPPRGMIDHSTGESPDFPGPLGENLHATTGPVVDPVEAVEGWAAEAKDFDPQRNTCRAGAMCGHYTQVVWRTTREVGCATSHCPRLAYRSSLVCNYFPAGNWEGQRPY